MTGLWRIVEENRQLHQILGIYQGQNIDTQHQLYVATYIFATTTMYLLLRWLIIKYFSNRPNPIIVISANFKNLRSRWLESFCSIAIFLLVSFPILARSLWKTYQEGILFDYMVNTSWVGKPEIIIAALFQGRNLCDLIVGVDSSMIILHHLMGSYSILMVTVMKPYRDRYLGNHCTYLVFMDFGSILFNLYALSPSKCTRNLYFYGMTLTNLLGLFWHWIAGSLGEDRVLHDPKVFVTVIVGSVLNYFRQKEVFAVCGFPQWLGGNGFISLETAFAILEVEETAFLPIDRKKGSVKCAVNSSQTWICTEIKKTE